MDYKIIVDYIIAHDLDFNQFNILFEKKYGYKPNKKTCKLALEYFEIG